LVCYELGLARVFDLTNKKEILRLDGLGLAMHSAAWSPDGKYFVTAGGNSSIARSAKQLCVWDANSGQLLKLFSDRTCHPRALAFSGDSKRFVSADSDGTVQVWQVTGPIETAPPIVVAKPPKVSLTSPHVLARNPGAVQSLSISPNGQFLLTGATNG